MLTKTEVMTRLGIRESQVQFYTRYNVVKPKSGGGGRGKAYHYSSRNLVEFGLIKKLFGYQMSIHVIRSIIEKLNEQTIFKRYFDADGNFKKEINLSLQVPYVAIYDAGESVVSGLVVRKKLNNRKRPAIHVDLKQYEMATIVRLDEEFEIAR